jgi:tyrosyl-tRNA synthetase
VPGLAAELEARGLVHQVTSPAALAGLDAGELTAYAGFDPSAPSLHVGHLLQLCTLRRFQLGGNRPIVLLGGATGLIGDPGGKSGERRLLSPEELAANVAGIAPQLERFVELSAAPGRPGALVLDNRQWLGALGLIEFLRDTGKHFTVNQMVAKESVRTRLERPEQGISYTEFSYMLLQAYDFLHLYRTEGCRLQLGGSDQWGNITAGVELIGRVAGGGAYGLTSPLLTKADGTKFGKTEAGTVWLDPARTSPYRLYQFFFNTEDAVVGTYLRSMTFLSLEEIAALEAETADHPQRRAAQRALARNVCSLVHGEDEVARAEGAAAALFGPDLSTLDERTLLEVVDEAPSSALDRQGLADGVALVDVLASSGLVRSRSEGRRQIAQGGISVNGVRQDDEDRRLGLHDLLYGRLIVLRRGRRELHLIEVR